MKKIYCDICGKEIKGTAKDKPVEIHMDLWHGTVLGSVHKGEMAIDACADCIARLCTEAMKNKEEV